MEIEWKFLLFLWSIVFNVIRREKPVNRWFSYRGWKQSKTLFFFYIFFFLRPLGRIIVATLQRSHEKIS